MEITQRSKLGYMIVKLVFGDESLEYSQDLSSGSVLSYSVPYQQIPKEFRCTSVVNKLLRSWISFCWILSSFLILWFVGVHSSSARGQAETNIAIALVAIFFVTFLAFRGFRRNMLRISNIDIVSFQTHIGKIQILRDKNEETILNEISRRRWERVRKLNMQIDRINDPQAEIRKFQWLQKNDYISEAELDEAIESIRNFQPLDEGKSKNMLN
jgi:hypothetical protein